MAAGVATPPWDCSNTLGGTRPAHGLCGAAGGDDYKLRPRCYVWGDEVAPPSGGWGAVWNSGESFVAAGVQPGDVLQFDNYQAMCDGSVWESTGGGPHSAVVSAVADKTLAVCQQDWNGVYNDQCGWVFFDWFNRCTSGQWTFSYDALVIYRPDSSDGGSSAPCQKCITQ
jgi:hypothetical protein